MLPSNLALSNVSNAPGGRACKQFAEARRGLFPRSGSTWIERAGAYAVFDGINAPITQIFGSGLFAQLTPATLAAIESFFLEKGAPVLSRSQLLRRHRRSRLTLFSPLPTHRNRRRHVPPCGSPTPGKRQFRKRSPNRSSRTLQPRHLRDVYFYESDLAGHTEKEYHPGK